MSLLVDGSCQFTLPVSDESGADPDPSSTPAFPDGVASVAGVHRGAWHCPHDATAGTDYCPFHVARSDQTPSSDLDPSRELVETVRAANRHADAHVRERTCQFVGAGFPTLDLEATVLGGDSRETVDFRGARFGTVDCRKARFEQPIDFSGAVFDPGPFPARYGTDALDPVLSRVRFGIDFLDATFTDLVVFEGARFRRPVLFQDAEFEMRARFKRARFLDHASFLTADFEDLAMFRESVFCRDARFQACVLTDLAGFRESHFGGRVSFDRVICEGDVEFDGADFTAPPTRVDLPGGVAGFAGRLTADDATITGRLSLNDCTFEKEFRIRDARIGTLRVRRVDTGAGTGFLDLARSTVDEGEIDQFGTGEDHRTSLVCDLYEATVGRVEFFGDDSEWISTHTRFLMTRHDGFDFDDDDDVDLRDTNYSIHRLGANVSSLPCYCADGDEHGGRHIVDDPDCPTHDRVPTPARVKTTYAYAKNGANEVGNNTVAGKFFYREMRADRRQIRTRIVDREARRGVASRGLDATRWGRSALLAGTTGYGEYPYRVVVTSIGIVVGFGVVYWQNLLGEFAFGPLEALLFSLQSFITFVIGPPQGPTLPGRAVSAVEGFVGAFFVALFVFTITKRINR